MSWIKENPFVATLGGITLVGAAGLLLVGNHFGSKYQQSLDEYTADAELVSEGEKLALYPKQENLDAKKKALRDYRDSISKLQIAFDKYRPVAQKPVTSQEFTDNLREADAKVREAFAAGNTKLPDAFFLGFETYKGTVARESATGVLNYQLGAVSELFLALAKAAPGEVKNVHRPKLIEEEGGKFDDPSAVSRALPIEVTFRGTEKSVRQFLSDLASSSTHFYAIRTIRVTNDKLTGPLPADVRFEEAPAPGASPESAGGIVLPGDAAAQPAQAALTDSSRKLIQLLGGEQLNVFLRIDILQFLPTKELPKS
ncbi:MAG TPA: Amuc_1100 family pilus-like protein [Luteolibacter sp.]